MLEPATILRLACLAVLCVSCAQRVDVGAEGNAIDLGVCLGASAKCGAPEVPRHTLDNAWNGPEASRCETSVDDSWHMDWWLPLVAVPCAPLGFCAPWLTAITGDGSVWLAAIGATSVAGNDERSIGGVFVAHYSPQGKLIAKRVLETAELDRMLADVHAAIAAQDGTGAVVLVHLDGETWVQRLDAQVNFAGPRVALTGVKTIGRVDVAPHASGGVYVSVGGSFLYDVGPTALALLDADLQPVWIQGSALASGRFSPAHSDELMWIGDQPDGQNIGNDVLVSYDERGNATRELELRLGGDLVSIATDGKISTLYPSVESPFPYELVEFTAEGALLEHVVVSDLSVGPDAPFEEKLAFVSATADRDGNSYFAHYSTTLSGGQGIAIVQRNADDGRCTKSIVAFEQEDDVLSLEEIPQSRLWRSDDGALYVRFQRGLARLSR